MSKYSDGACSTSIGLSSSIERIKTIADGGSIGPAYKGCSIYQARAAFRADLCAVLSLLQEKSNGQQ